MYLDTDGIGKPFQISFTTHRENNRLEDVLDRVYGGSYCSTFASLAALPSLNMVSIIDIALSDSVYTTTTQLLCTRSR